MFYDRFVELCAGKGVSPSRAVLDMGFSKSIITGWKKGAAPSDVNLMRIANYFGISVGDLMEEQNKKPPEISINGDDELTGYLEQLATRPEMRMLFSVTKDASKADVEAAVRIIEALRKQEDGKG